MGIDEKYQYAIVYSGQNKDLWILSRFKSCKIDNSVLNNIIENLKNSGYTEQISKLIIN